ncbi:hypothetical protein MINTM008_49440 [Mycobacterium intracellulare]|nr:hypothetical protein MINTM002_46770 [Mycobacterium intracellulare]BCO59519.1 hypothetical protein MINTM005_47630 [Mycobacterium intracellulare]BCO64781.1 hypothetical protein MINTM006_47310 [Mycobacterium intracellulare]BCO70095.1 hypothetical protein MINTM007_47060 [Mycobacterium intracellulare]BCO75609.1 hypothetical protein MINTM008_49440 [Mycobacterium intracellulare]
MNSPAEVSMRGGEFDGEFLTSLRQEVDAWSAHDALAQLVAMFGGVFPRHANLAARLAALDEFSEVWDYRGRARARRGGQQVRCQDADGGARWMIPRLDLPDRQLDTITTLAQQLGLTDESRRTDATFDYMLVIGTGRYSNMLRARWARNLAAENRVGHIVLAAASRQLLPSEHDAAASCAPGARTEFELLAAAATDAFGVDTREAVRHGRQRVGDPHRGQMVWRFSEDSNDVGLPITLLEAPSPDPNNRRATSADTFTFTARSLDMQRSSCLLVTGQPFVPYQNFDALRTLTLPFGIGIETVGFGIDRYEGLHDMDLQHPAKLLQEVRSTIRAGRSLLERVEAAQLTATRRR